MSRRREGCKPSLLFFLVETDNFLAKLWQLRYNIEYAVYCHKEEWAVNYAS